jgi:hypothetical protein
MMYAINKALLNERRNMRSQVVQHPTQRTALPAYQTELFPVSYTDQFVTFFCGRRRCTDSMAAAPVRTCLFVDLDPSERTRYDYTRKAMRGK